MFNWIVAINHVWIKIGNYCISDYGACFSPFQILSNYSDFKGKSILGFGL